MKNFNNLNIQTSKMPQKQSNSQPLLQMIGNQILQSLFESETIIQTFVKLSPQAQQTFHLKLKDQYILFYDNNELESEPTHFIRLDSDVKFQKILTIPKLPKQVNSSLNTSLKGFKLIHQNGQQISFYIQFSDLTNIWVKYLSKHINQLGFHNYFKPIRKLGKGASASVYQIIKIQSGQRFAAKIFSKEILKNSHAKFYSFKNQVEILRNLQHKNLLSFEGVFETDKSLYLVVQVLSGGNLFEYLMSRKTRLNLSETKVIMRNLMEGLAELQNVQVIHRDIKLENIILRHKDSLEPVIADFGLAGYSWEDYPMKTSGTPGYLSPEVFNADKGAVVSSKSDVFSAGVVFHVLLMGRYLFEGKDPQTVFQNNKKMSIDLLKPEYINIDKSAYDLLSKMLVTNADQRISASQCLEHSFLRIDSSCQKPQVSPASTNQDYHF